MGDKLTRTYRPWRLNRKKMTNSDDTGKSDLKVELSNNHELHTSAIASKILNTIALLASIPVWFMARKAAVWSSGSENWDALFLFLFGGGVLIAQVIILLAGLIMLIFNIKKWSRRDKWICTTTLPLPVISTLLAFVHSSPFYG